MESFFLSETCKYLYLVCICSLFQRYSLACMVHKCSTARRQDVVNQKLLHSREERSLGIRMYQKMHGSSFFHSTLTLEVQAAASCRAGSSLGGSWKGEEARLKLLLSSELNYCLQPFWLPRSSLRFLPIRLWQSQEKAFEPCCLSYRSQSPLVQKNK